MPLTDEEWAAFMNEYNAMVDDVEKETKTLRAACKAYERRVTRAGGREGVQEVAETYVTLAEAVSRRLEDRIIGLSKRINEMRALGEI